MMKSTLASFILVSCGVMSVSFWSKTSGPATTLILASLSSLTAVSRPLCPQPVESCMSPIRWYFFFWMWSIMNEVWMPSFSETRKM